MTFDQEANNDPIQNPVSDHLKFPHLAQLRRFYEDEEEFEEAIENVLVQTKIRENNFNQIIKPILYGSLGYGLSRFIPNSSRSVYLIPTIGISLWIGHNHAKIMNKIKQFKIPITSIGFIGLLIGAGLYTSSGSSKTGTLSVSTQLVSSSWCGICQSHHSPTSF